MVFSKDQGKRIVTRFWNCKVCWCEMDSDDVGKASISYGIRCNKIQLSK